MKIETERLWLYDISDEEMQQLIQKETDVEMKQAYSEMLSDCIRDPENKIWHAVWLMELKESPKEIVGDFCFKGIERDGMIEIGYGLRDGYCGKGYMTECVKAICFWAMDQAGVTRVEAETGPENLASQKVLSSAGFEPSGENGKEGPRFVYRL